MLALAVACGDDSDDGVAAGTSSTSASSTTITDTTTTDTTSSTTTSSTQPDEPSAPMLVMASPTGVEILSDPSTEISTEHAAAAYPIGLELVVFQDAAGMGSLFPPSAEGPVKVWSAGEVRVLPADPQATRAHLLGAAIVDGAPVALVAERFGGANPENTFEELVRIDLRDDTRTTIVRRPAWESGHSAARLLPGGDVIGLLGAEASLLLARWSPTNEEALWTVEVGFDTHRDLTLLDGDITLSHLSFDSERDFTPVLTITTYDEASGEEVSSRSLDISDPDGEISTGVFCRDWTSEATLVCGRGGEIPLSLSVDDGSFSLLPGEPGSIPTAVRDA